MPTPYFSSLGDFFSMAGYGGYVWSCYGLTAAAIIGLILYSRSQREATYRQIRNQQARRLARRDEDNR